MTPTSLAEIEQALVEGPLACDCVWAADSGVRPRATHWLPAVARFIAEREAELLAEITALKVGLQRVFQLANGLHTTTCHLQNERVIGCICAAKVIRDMRAEFYPRAGEVMTRTNEELGLLPKVKP